MEKTSFQRFIELINFDQAFIDLERQRAQISSELERAQQSFQETEKEIEKERLLVGKLRQEVNTQELSMRSLDEKERILRQRAAEATTSREYQGLIKEGDRCRLEQHKQEEQLLVLWNKLEQAQKSLKSLEQKIKEKQTELTTEISELMKRQSDLCIKAEVHEKQRNTFTEGLPEEWVEKYTRMRLQVANPIVPVIAGTCGGCSYILTPQVMLYLNSRQLISCSGCYRLLYKDYEDGKQ